MEYTPIEVACGPSNIWVVGKVVDKTFLSEAGDDNIEVKDILDVFKHFLLKDKTLIPFLGLDKEDKKPANPKGKKSLSKKTVVKDEFNEYGDKIIPDPFEIRIPKDEFADIILNHPYL